MNSSGQQDLAESFERVYQAACRMLWAQGRPSWRSDRRTKRWPDDRCTAFQELERVLRSVDSGSSQPGELSDPARHVIARRAPGGADRPLTFDEALRDWEERLAADPGYLVERKEGGFTDLFMGPGLCVVIPHARQLKTLSILRELYRRLAPGRPAVVIGSEAAELSGLAHEAADALRAPLGVEVPTPHPGKAPWISPVSRPVSEVPDLEARLEELRRAAWRAAENVPSVEELMAAGDLSVARSVAEAAAALRELLAGRPAVVWQEKHESIDPARHLVSGSVPGSTGGQPTSFAQEASSWRKQFALVPVPWTPPTYRRPPAPEMGDRDVVLSSTRALVFAELLDEFAARLYPGRRSGVIHYGAYDFGHSLMWGFGRELKDISI
ncbi:hypothetical protein DMH02_002005 [Streptomyces sp. WAC 00631]|uniref:hypothetical protein n=1 Tax=unclassified Streptomyces TaxID=2593676 RepID=UPI000F79CEEF|nr:MULTISPECIES: hypothetical protein [unclassified Streptomyces]MCC5032066.1 hypothetical protein [Streptomyces sp. WAC 00631]MCC9740168.1 hypothetical protein [Streptomyces sp. MNU89]